MIRSSAAPSGIDLRGQLVPGRRRYRAEVVEHGLAVGRQLAERGVRSGDYGIDFLVLRGDAGWKVMGCELNLRSTGASTASPW